MRVIEKFAGRLAVPFLLALMLGVTGTPRSAFAQPPAPQGQATPAAARGGEVNLVLPDLS